MELDLNMINLFLIMKNIFLFNIKLLDHNN